MDLPATQAMSEDEFPATQQVVNNEKEEKTLVGTLLINKQTYSIFSGLTKIGRHPNCEIVLNSETVSKIHAEIEATSPNRPVFIKDLKSSNLTRINRGKLRPYSLYQVTDGNELIFGNVIAIFKLYQPIDDSLVSCTPQVNRKLKAIIPGTPDSSMNTSSASESDNSIIPGTQTDKIDSNFRLPGIPVRSSRSDEHRSPRVPAFTLDDLPSPLSKEKKRHDDICEAKTQRPSTSNETEGHDSSDDIYTAATQKASKIVKPVTSDENIYDMATQRPIDSDEGTDELENVTTQRLNYKYPQSSKVTDNQSINDLETQPFDAEKLNSVKRKSLDASIYSALTQKNVPDNSDNESIEDLETQQFNLANNVSIHSAATQKNDYTKSNSKSIEDLETQAFDTRKSSVFNGDLNDVSIHSAPTQKNVCNEPTETIEDLETQQVDMRKSNSSNNSSHDVSIHSAATQKNVSKDLSKSMENLETQQFDLQKKALKRESYDDSIYSATTQKVNNEAPHEFIENVETQKFDANKPEKFVVPSPFQRECNKSLDVSETERCIPVDNILESIENMETQHFVTTTTSETSTSNKVTDESIHAAEILKLRSAEPNNESIDNLETEQFINKTTNEIIDESTESMHLVDESPRISSLSFTSQNTSPVDLKDTKESSSNAGIQRIEQENEQNNTSENPNNSNLQFKEPLVSSSITYSNTTNTINDKEISVSKSVGNNEEEKSILEGENEEEMFSQNLIEDCPFAFLPEESVSNKNQSSTISQIEEKTKIKENKIINGSIFNASTNTEIHKSEAAASKSHDIINESDSETDEEGVFTNQSSNEDKCNQSSSKYTSKTGKDAVPNEADSETDEEGAFSNHLSNQSEGDVKNSKQNNDKIRENDSETDEEGVFSDRMVKEKKNQSSLSKKDNNVDSDEDIFDNIPDDDGKTELNESVILSSKPDSLIHQDLIFDDNCEEKSTIIKKSHTANTKSFEDNKINDIEVDDLASTQLINTGMTDNFLASTQVISKEKDSAKKTGENFDDLELVPTQKIVDTQYTESQFPAQNSSRRSNDRWNTNSTIDLAPTQKLTDTQLCTESQFATSINKQLNDCSNAVNKLDLASTQIITETQSCTESQFAKPVGKQLNDKCNTEKKAVVAETAPCTELQLATEINDELPNDLINRNADIEDLECKNAPTKDSNDLEQKLSLSQSKRQLEELEITCNKKVKTTDDAQNVQSDLFDNVEKDLGEMFEGPENKPSEVDQSALLTQQLENILESSQNDDSFVTDLNESKPSPTLSSGRISKTKNRRRAMLLGKADPLSPLVKPVINLNDTIERNLNKLFDDNVNNMKAYETDEMMTQQLKSILQSQDDHHMTNNEDITVTKSPVLSKTCEKKKNRLSLSVNLNASSTSKKQAKQQTPKPSCVQPSSSNKTVELQEADEYLANLKSNKTRNATDTLSDEERIHSQSSTDNEREIVYKRGMIGFSSTMRPVSTKEPVALLELKGRSFTSDSQSDGDESSILGHTKRFSLSLSKHVDLNSSLSSLSDQEVGKKLTAKPSTLSLKRTGNKHPSSSSNHPKRVLARGTRGFTSELQPIESEDLVSAASTESDEELRSLPTTSKKVCTTKLYRKVTVNLTKLSPTTVAKITSKIPTSEKGSDPDSDDSEFLKSMPSIKIAGTVDCPPTDSQLAAPSDPEDDDDSLKVPSPVDIVIPPKWNWYLQKRYDLVYKKNAVKSLKRTPKKDKDENQSDSPSLQKHEAKILSVDEILAEIDANRPIGRKRILVTPKQRRTRRRSASDSDENNVVEKTVNTRSKQAQSSTQVKGKTNSTPDQSPKFDIEMVKGNENSSFSKAQRDNSDSESESSIIPKFTPLPQFNLNVNYVDSDSDSEFEQMRLACKRTLAKPSTYAPLVRSSRGGRIPRAKRTSEKTSPVLTRRRHQSALSKCNSLNVTHTDNDRKAEILCEAGTVDQSAFVFQEAGDSSKAEGVPKTIQSRMSSLTIIRTKRSVASDVDDAQNRPPKRSKTTPVDEERPKLQQLSPAPVSVADPDKKRVSKVPKTLDSFVVNYNSKNITDSSDTSAIENSVVEETQNEKSNRSQTRGRAAAANRKKTKHEALTVHSNNSSKENLVVENSDVESAPYTSKARNIRLKRNLNITDPSVIKNSSKDEISNSSVESDSKTKKRGRATRQKKAMSVKEPVVTKKVATIIQDSDAEESDESEFLKKESKNKLVETIKSSHSGKSNNSKVIEAESQNEKEKDVEQMISGKSNKSDVNVTKSKRTRRVKESDLEKKDSSLDAVSKKINTRTRRGIKVDNSSLEESSSSDSAATKGNKSDQDKNVKESVLEKFNADVNKTSKNRQIKQADAIKIKSNVEESHEDEVTLDSDLGIPDPSTKPSRSSRATKTNVTLNKGTRSRKANARDQSSDSVFSESDAEKDRNVSLANKSSSSRPVRQTRARKASTNVSTVDTPSSEESQEIAEILQNSSGEEANRSRKRNARRAKNTPNSSEDTQDSESNNTQEDNVFERPVSRPKRARLVKSTKNKSSSQNNLPVDEEIRTRSPQQSSTSQKRTPSPNLPVTPSRSTPSRNRRTMSMSPMKGASYKVLFTGERSEVHRKIVAKLGGSEMEDPEKCSILVTDKVRRTYKFLCCLAQGIPIVSVAWLNDSGKAHRFLNWENYVLQDPTAEAKFKFKLKESLEKASTHRLLEGYTVLITPRITQPPVAELKGMVISSGGKPLVKPTTKWQENTVIITKEDDLQNAKKFMAKAPKSVTMHSTEFILTGILRQELSLEEFKLTV
ncbi:uncharacterized protein LOC100118457 isoform X2 [Nasonia vitripennis]|uniref:Mediator of DNA damage checkpoint protein 1 n=1 Tax=Nasonia vitripennis TaxID=7425 RepID=A0A7M7Q2A0_NASVI|nr:uncharacterized protein LOC100118457 isoform X2 [Nasonia vitripennis]